MRKVEKYEKLNKPGLWFVCSGQPATELKQYIYDFAVESGLPIVVYSGIPKKEIQNAVIDLIKTKCIENAENENERDWLEQEMIVRAKKMWAMVSTTSFIFLMKNLRKM
ncbi:MAG: hypothetical protein LIR46_12670 [Bacteroidota bacterium]|nr:hypothetical protein [Bacteroidota bacterium]